MNAYALIGVAIAALVYVPLFIGVWQKKVQQNFATFFLWGLLDAIAAGSILMKGGNFLLPAIYTLLSVTVLIAIMRSKTFKWGLVEWITLSLVFVCMVIWAVAGPTEATIASTIALAIATIPQLKDMWEEPQKALIRSYVGFTLANGVSILGGKDWSIAERFYPTVSTIMTVLCVLVLLRAFMPDRKNPAYGT